MNSATTGDTTIEEAKALMFRAVKAYSRLTIKYL